ncbi:hypothetical protein DFH29DRAFT_924949, partial [Suillus ampliporus]
DASLLPQHCPNILCVLLHLILHIRSFDPFRSVTRTRNAVAEFLFFRIRFPFRVIVIILVCRTATKVQGSIWGHERSADV